MPGTGIKGYVIKIITLQKRLSYDKGLIKEDFIMKTAVVAANGEGAR
jgi:hypothetical protein